VGRLVAQHGPGRIEVTVDVRDVIAIGHGWSAGAAGIAPVEAILGLRDRGVTTFEVTAIDRDGLLGVPDLALCGRLVEFGGVSIIASGGISSLEDLRAVRERGCAGAIVGRAIYEGRIDLGEALVLLGSPSRARGRNADSRQ
jgi:phosphoribosylformimino-5-aminoimidazole carboxamide ribotide isomerase